MRLDRELVASDAAARRAAQAEFVRPFVLEAGAGTGKTQALVSRIIVWLIGPGWQRARAALPADVLPERIAARAAERVVALTFTEAAATEMCTRAGELLSEIARGGMPRGVVPELLPAPSERATRAGALLAHSDKIGAHTLHAYARQLLAAYPLEAGMVPGFEIDAAGDLQSAIVREVLESQIGALYGEPGDPHALALACGPRPVAPKQLEEALLALVSARVDASELERDPWTPESVSDLFEAGRERVGAALTICAPFAALTRAPKALEALTGLSQLQAALDRVTDPTRICVDSLREAVEDVCRSCRERFADWSKAKLNKAEAKTIGAAGEALAPCMTRLLSWLDHVRALDAGRLDHARRVLAPLLARVERELRARGVQTYAGLIRDAVALLEREDIAARVRREIDQLLVDEFQDTDTHQCTMLRRLAFEGPERERPGLFLVGDPKQSIYGWRQADLAAYEDFVAEAIRAGGVLHRLSVNYRSLPPILREVDRALEPILTYERGIQPAFQRLIPHRSSEPDTRWERDAEAASPAPVEYWLSFRKVVEDATTESKRAKRRASDHADAAEDAFRAIQPGEAAALEARALASELVKQHAAGVAWKDMALLLRSRSDLDEFVRALQARDIPYVVQGDRSYYRRREIIEAAAWVRCVLDPRDAVALVSWLRSSPIGVPDAALLPLWNAKLPKRVMELRAPDAEPLERLSDIVRECARSSLQSAPELRALAGAWERTLIAGLESLAALRASFERDPCDVFVERLRTLSLIEASEASRYLGRYRLANLDRFFRHLIHDLEASSGNVTTMLRRLRRRVRQSEDAEESRAGLTEQDAVSILTIHQAKGLDFRHVYLMQTYRLSSPSGRPDTEVSSANGRRELRLLAAATPGWFHVLDRELCVERAEQVRTLYVALTRAKDRLVISGVSPKPRSSSRAPTHAQLLCGRLPEAAVLEAILEAPQRDRDGVLWRSLDHASAARDSDAVPSAGEAGASKTPEASADREIAVHALRLRQLREAAQRRSRRPLGAAASRLAPREIASNADAARSESTPMHVGHGGRRDPAFAGDGAVARAAGTILHRLLEDLDLDADARAWIELPAALEALLRVHSPPDRSADVRSVVRRQWSAFARGPLSARLHALAPHVVSRELPFVCEPEVVGLADPAPHLVVSDRPGAAIQLESDDERFGEAAWFSESALDASTSGAGANAEAPLAYVSGVMDLVYQDPRDGAWVVVDYKTDAVDSERAAIERAQRYADQAQLYARALRAAWTLDRAPRVELWFLSAGAIIPMP